MAQETKNNNCMAIHKRLLKDYKENAHTYGDVTDWTNALSLMQERVHDDLHALEASARHDEEYEKRKAELL